jgi:hypothetical protein
MFAKTACDQCGTALAPEARFCRQCGKAATGHAHGASVTEATTRTLNAQLPYEAPPHYGDARLAPHAPNAPAHANATQALEQATCKPRKLTAPKLALVIIAALLLLLPFAGFAMTMVWRMMAGPRRIVVRQREMPAIAPPPAPDMRGPQAGAPAPPPPPGISPQLIYPGAETTANFIQGDGGSQLHLRTQDAAAKVADWYAARVNPVQTINSPGGITVMQFAGGQVIIRPEGPSTSIFIMHHAN